MPPPRILVTGAGGYVGACLVERLQAEGEGARLRVAGRAPERLRARWPQLEAVRVDALEPASIPPAVRGVDTAYYLVHSMAAGEAGFAERDLAAARNFAAAAREAGVRLVVYLGGLGQEGDALSQHLASRQATGRELAAHGPAVVEFRAGMVIGPGSASFRMLADLVRRLPVMVTPRWVRTRSQPISERDATAYLAAARDLDPPGQHTVVEVGGADVLTYHEMMERFAALHGWRRAIVPVPVLTPRLSSLWCGLVTSVPTAIARPLIESLRNEAVVRSDLARRLFPGIQPVGFDLALRWALARGGR